VHVEFKKQCLEMTVDKLLEQFVLTKYTGLEKPGTSNTLQIVRVKMFMTLKTKNACKYARKRSRIPSRNQGRVKYNIIKCVKNSIFHYIYSNFKIYYTF